jgi:hypothetical protein
MSSNPDSYNWGVADARIGEKNNEDITVCKICRDNGFPNEAVEIKGFRILNYSDDSYHRHKDLWKDLAPRLWKAKELA